MPGDSLVGDLLARAAEASECEANFMYRALELAERGLGHTRPNPAVGAVIVKDGKILSCRR